MTLVLHFHPLASFCWKTLIALYENDTPFRPVIVDLGDDTSRAAFFKLWPAGKFPVLQDDDRNELTPESTIIIEYLAQHYPGRTPLLTGDPERDRGLRLIDRFYDFYLHEPMQKVVGDRLRPAGSTDPFGVEQARAQLRQSYGMLEQDLRDRTWAAGEAFSLADCSAFPALFYGDKVEPLGDRHTNVSRYLRRLLQRPSVARVVEEAQPYFKFFPYNKG
jgi:glutathione S-transferase